MPNPLRTRLATIEPVDATGRQGDDPSRGISLALGMLSESDSAGGGDSIVGPVEIKGGQEMRRGGEGGGRHAPLSAGDGGGGIAMDAGEHENHISGDSNEFISCSVPEIRTHPADSVKCAHKSDGPGHGGEAARYNNSGKCVIGVSPAVEIDIAPEIVWEEEEEEGEEEDLMSIMFRFDTSPKGEAGSRREPGGHQLIRPVPRHLHLRGADGAAGHYDRTETASTFTPIPRSVSLSPCGSPVHPLSRSPSPAWSMSSLSPATARRRRTLNLSSGRNLDAILGASPPVRIPRDPIQPSAGSISDVHSEASNDDEESDVFPLAPRQRSSTCPENRSFRRRTRLRNMNRPPTPPPGGADECDIEKQLSRLAVKEKLRIPSRSLPEVPESPGGKFSRSVPNLFSE